LSALAKRPKLIATDLDGTIVLNYGEITPRTKKAFHDANDAGVKIYFATGRPIRWMKEIAAAFPFGGAILGNGAIHYDLHNEKVLDEWLIPIENQIATVQKLRSAIPDVAFAIELKHHFHREKNYNPRWDVGLDQEGVHDIMELMSDPAAKILARCSTQKLTSDEMLAIANKELSELVTVTHSNSLDSLLEISALGVSKGSTLAKLAQRHGFSSEEVVTFGDNPNDFAMLKWAGRSWAMGDGHPDAPKYAKSVTDPHTEDGVARVIEELLELPE
jgi:Cof subfamily protein (haloacid dehalogenase superfamily)